MIDIRWKIERLVTRPHFAHGTKNPKDFNHNTRVSSERSELCSALLFEQFDLYKRLESLL